MGLHEKVEEDEMTESSMLRVRSAMSAQTNASGGSDSISGPMSADILQGMNSRRFYAAAISDALDSLGYRNQVMHSRLRPLLQDDPGAGFIGHARTVQWMVMNYVVEEDPYGLEIEVVDSLKNGDVLVHSTDHTGSNTPWGELMSTVAVLRGAVGCICDSNIRDCTRIREMGFPVYYSGIRALDSKGRGRVQAYDVPISCGEVLVHPQDIIFADFDGVVVIPSAIAGEVFESASLKTTKEKEVREELKRGKSLREVYETYKIL
jgi:4-hydroxy-4-methyl-2-oxoglutarate aldolase